MTTAIATIACVWVAAALVYRALAFRAVARIARDARAAPAVEKLGLSTVLLRPLHGAPTPVEECLESLFRAAEAADVPVVLGFARPDDPVRAIVDRVRERHPGTRATVRIGHGPAGVNRKVANLLQIDEKDASEILVLCDADVRVAPDFVARITAPFADPKVGLATCPYVSAPYVDASSVNTRKTSTATRIDALMTNTHFIPSACLAVELEGLHFGLGAAIAVRRSALQASGGFEALLDRAADDYHIARNVERAGFSLAWVPMFVDHVLEDEGWGRSLARHLRWAATMRALRPIGHCGVIVTHGVVPAIGALLALGPAAIALPIAWWSAEIALAWPVRRTLGLSTLDWFLLPIADLLAFATWLGGFFARPSPP